MNIHSSFYSMNIKLIDLFKSQSTFECRILIFLSIYFSLTFLLVLQTSHATSFIFQKIYSLNGNQNISLEIEAFTQLSRTRYWFWRVFIGNSFNLVSQYIILFLLQNFFNILKMLVFWILLYSLNAIQDRYLLHWYQYFLQNLDT